MSSDPKDDREDRPTLEWVVGIISAAAVAGILGFLGREAIVGETQPPNLVATIDRVDEVEQGTLIVVSLSNNGDQAAAEVTLEARFAGAGTEPAQKEIRFDYVAAHGVRQGAFIIEGPAPRPADVRLTVHGYVQP